MVSFAETGTPEEEQFSEWERERKLRLRRVGKL